MAKRHIRDMECVFKNVDGVDSNKLIYSFDNIIPADNSEELLHGITVIEPGDVNGEYHMTKGHVHKNRCAEIYIGLEGSGIVLCEAEGDVKELNISENVLAYIAPGVAHRLINTGDEPLSVLCICRADAGHEYGVDFTRRYFRR